MDKVSKCFVKKGIKCMFVCLFKLQKAAFLWGDLWNTNSRTDPCYFTMHLLESCDWDCLKRHRMFKNGKVSKKFKNIWLYVWA